MAYQTAPFQMTSNDLQCHYLIASFFRCDFSWNCSAVDKISTELQCHGVSQWEMSFTSFL